ncbi:hypothetical protein B9Z55_027036 [Caenorhabditis nigoni]|uniref:F-box domain-containing protein n=1 Tax=Caenorhabditis nigoni TaxID=1611254 RepID=A0A2G5SID1_9PELO|nr:hypothetical protein B9Z55_027036 [Caenorhabditis nigoni]
MDLTSGIIDGNHHYLKTCILYEVLQKKPIFDSYRDFCDTVGQDPMEYPDFEYWYYRFYHGNRDLDYDRSADPKPKTIMDIPAGSMTKIAEYLDPVERTFLRSMNRTIKAVVDSFPPVFEKIDISVSDTSTRWILNDKMFSCYKKVGGCTLHKPNCSVEKSERCHVKQSLEYLAPLMRIPNIQVSHFSLKLLYDMLDCVDLLSIPVNAKNIPYSQERYNYQTIFDTDQFKQAKSVTFKTFLASFNVEELMNFSHLKSFKCRVKADNAVEDVKRIRDIISTFEELESCELEFHGRWNSIPMREFAEALGEDIPIGPLVQQATITHLYRIAKTNDSLEFKITDERMLCRINVRKFR